MIVGSISNHDFSHSMLNSFARVCFSKSIKIYPKLNEKSRKKTPFIPGAHLCVREFEHLIGFHIFLLFVRQQ